jgi:hypothetical protein
MNEVERKYFIKSWWVKDSPPQRKPLTDEQCDSIEHKAYLSTISKGKPMGDYAKKLMRAIERAHGIGENK